LGGIFDIDSRLSKIEEERKHTLDPSFWDNQTRAQEILQRIGAEEFWVNKYLKTQAEVDDVSVLQEFCNAGEVTEADVAEQYAIAQDSLNKLEIAAALPHEEDTLPCILKIQSGAGGTESCDWANMLLRMYLMWAEKRGFEVRELHRVDGDVVGIKSVSIEISGDSEQYIYGWLKGENGVHRLVRPSPFNAKAKRQTTFVSVFVYPLIDDSIEVKINPSDIEWDVFRASGAGGQHVNRTESAVRLRHLPSGIVVECQAQRSQHQNREKALQMLKSELYQLELRRRNAERDIVEAQKSDIEWGSQIRSYVLDDRRIKDHRSNHQTSDIKRVLDGDIDDFLKATFLHSPKN
jgi:peptide chain release factor 2